MKLPILIFFAAIACANPLYAQDRPPLLVDGKQTVFQRVLTKTDASLHPAPDTPALEPLRSFQPLYVYDRQGDWLEVGRGIQSGPEGWTPADDTVVWKQNIVVSMANPAGRERQLFFDTEAALMDVITHESPIGMAREKRLQVLADGAGAVDGVVSMEPADFVDIQQNFYLLPILDWREAEHPMTFEIMRVLELASLPLEEASPLAEPEKEPSVGVVFAIDTTRSMQPYIEATAAAVRDIVERIQNGPAGPYTRFGAVGFRDSVEAARARDPERDIEYRTNTFLDLSQDQDARVVTAAFSAISEAQASTVGFSEDSVSGVLEAINLPGWETAGKDGGPVNVRFVFIISDAGPKSQNDETLPEAVRAYDADAIRTLASEKNVRIGVIHLKSPDGVPNHRAAEAAYTAMSRLSDGESLYFPLDLTGGGAARDTFRPVIDDVVNKILANRERTIEELQAAAAEGELDGIGQETLAMRLEWLGRQRDAGAERLFRFWAVDRSLENPLVPALDVRLLITKNELSTMSDVLREISTIGDQTQGEMREGEFFELLRGALARMAQNPGTLVDTEFATLDEAVSEYLADLPYRSPILGTITPERWLNMGAERRVTLDRVKSRLQLLEHFHDSDVWTPLYEGAPDGEHVFAMPFEALP